MVGPVQMGVLEIHTWSDPQHYTRQFAKVGRQSRILLDYLHNNRTNTSVAAF